MISEKEADYIDRWCVPFCVRCAHSRNKHTHTHTLAFQCVANTTRAEQKGSTSPDHRPDVSPNEGS